MKHLTVSIPRWFLWVAGALVVLNSGVFVFISTPLRTLTLAWGYVWLLAASGLALGVLGALAYRFVVRLWALGRNDSMRMEAREREHTLLMELPPETFEQRMRGVSTR